MAHCDPPGVARPATTRLAASWRPPRTRRFWRFRDSMGRVCAGGRGCVVRRGFLDVDERLKELSAKGDALKPLNAVVDFELFRAALARAVPRSERSKGGRPPFDHVLMLKADPPSQPQPVGRAHRVSDPGPAVVHAVSRAGAGRHGAGRQHDLDLPRSADAGQDRRRTGDRGCVRASRRHWQRPGFWR